MLLATKKQVSRFLGTILSLYLMVSFGSVLAQIDLQKIEPVVLENRGHAIFQYWEFSDDPGLWELRPIGLTAIAAYRDTLDQVLGSETLADILRIRHQIIDDRTELDTVTNGDRKNALLVLTDSIGRLRRINNLEAQILNYQLSRYPLFSHPTEFHAFIMKNDRLDRIRIYFASSDTPWPPKPGVIIKDIEQIRPEGWRLIGHLHNHYEPADNGYIGILAPSLADAHYFKMLRERFSLEKAFITNGYHTVVLDGTIFPLFESH